MASFGGGGIRDRFRRASVSCDVARFRRAVSTAMAMSAMATVTAVAAMEEVHQRAGKQYQVGREAQGVLPVLAKEEERGDHRERRCKQGPSAIPGHIRTLLNLREFPITLTDDRAIAAAAMIGDSRRPKAG